MHEPVLLEDVLEILHIKRNSQVIDATTGMGGHTRAIARRGARVLGIEADPEMLVLAEKSLKQLPRVKLVKGNFRNIAEIALKNGVKRADAILMDLGISRYHYKVLNRGFSFEKQGQPLDMRIDPGSQAVRASDLVNAVGARGLSEIFTKSQVKRVLAARKIKRLETVGDLLWVLGTTGRGKIHPATKPFMNLRIAVNSELENLAEALPQAYELLSEGGTLAVITFHSGEDRIVKNFMKNKAMSLVLPTKEETEKNKSARSAKLRYIRKNET